jgi:hypothetical protein
MGSGNSIDTIEISGIYPEYLLPVIFDDNSKFFADIISKIPVPVMILVVNSDTEIFSATDADFLVARQFYSMMQGFLL